MITSYTYVDDMRVEVSKKYNGHGLIRRNDECTYFEYLKINNIEFKYNKQLNCVIINGVADSGMKITNLKVYGDSFDL